MQAPVCECVCVCVCVCGGGGMRACVRAGARVYSLFYRYICPSPSRPRSFPIACASDTSFFAPIVGVVAYKLFSSFFPSIISNSSLYEFIISSFGLCAGFMLTHV